MCYCKHVNGNLFESNKDICVERDQLAHMHETTNAKTKTSVNLGPSYIIPNSLGATWIYAAEE
jgi:hypothetical protein